VSDKRLATIESEIKLISYRLGVLEQYIKSRVQAEASFRRNLVITLIGAGGAVASAVLNIWVL
jgi:hypothetical protein